jgi:hypothetical protein
MQPTVRHRCLNAVYIMINTMVYIGSGADVYNTYLLY